MNEGYFVVFSGLDKPETHFKQKMVRLGVSPATVEQIIKKSPVILKAGMPLDRAKRYADAVREAGGIVRIRRHGLQVKESNIDRPINIEPLENFTMCPQCGYKQLKRDKCIKCGFNF